MATVISCCSRNQLGKKISLRKGDSLLEMICIVWQLTNGYCLTDLIVSEFICRAYQEMRNLSFQSIVTAARCQQEAATHSSVCYIYSRWDILLASILLVLATS